MLYIITKRLKYVFYVILNNMITSEQIYMFKNSADSLYKVGDHTSATILYFKTLFAIQDFLLIERTGESPKDHTERFKKLKISFPELFIQLDKEFTTYRDTYSKLIDKETCFRIKKVVEDDLEKYKIKK